MKVSNKIEENMLIITGASDDLITVTGGGHNEEFIRQEGLIACSDGTLLGFEYDDDGIWRFTLKAKGKCFDSIESGIVVEDTFDKVFMKTGIEWVVIGEQCSYKIRHKA